MKCGLYLQGGLYSEVTFDTGLTVCSYISLYNNASSVAKETQQFLINVYEKRIVGEGWYKLHLPIVNDMSHMLQDDWQCV